MAVDGITLDKGAQRRLETDLIIWLTTVGQDGRPHAVPVWFLWDGKTFLIYSLPGQKVRDVQRQPDVELHLNTDRSGDKVLRVEGRAEVVKDQPPAYRVPKYVAKYREKIKGYGWTPKGFSEQYHVALRVNPARVRT
jgi:PPOX class probable F420-dependent enzyme